MAGCTSLLYAAQCCTLYIVGVFDHRYPNPYFHNVQATVWNIHNTIRSQFNGTAMENILYNLHCTQRILRPQKIQTATHTNLSFYLSQKSRSELTRYIYLLGCLVRYGPFSQPKCVHHHLAYLCPHGKL